MFELLTRRTPKAKKNYICDWCCEKINIGEKHEYYSGVFCGDFSSTRMHLECYAAMQTLPYDELAEGFMPGEFARGSILERGRGR